MKKGPLLNNNSRNFTTRDSLGIESVAAAISRDLCPIVNTVTPRAFYWPFMVWIYYDFYKYSGIAEHTRDDFDKRYLKRQDYFFVLSQLLTKNPDQSNLVGKLNSQIDINNNKTGMFVFNPDYFSSRYGGMQYYNAGCISMDYIREIDVDTNTRFSFPKLTAEGKKMALDFQKIIQGTEYYKTYRLNDIPVPHDVLIEYGNYINIGLKGFEDCKESLRQHLFDARPNVMLKKSSDYIKYFFTKYDLSRADLATYRNILFDYFSCRGEKEEISPELKDVAIGWEIVVGRQYFTSGLEGIWKYMLEQIRSPKTKKEWIEYCLNSTNWSCNINAPLTSILDECNFCFIDREKMIYDAAHFRNPEKMVENGLRIVLSMYNRFVDRTDLGAEAGYLTKGNETASISFDELIERVNEFKSRSIKDFVIYMMNFWLIEQHYRTAFEKLMQSRDGFYYDIVNGQYVYKSSFDMDFQGIRLYQLTQVMKDLDML